MCARLDGLCRVNFDFKLFMSESSAVAAVVGLKPTENFAPDPEYDDCLCHLTTAARLGASSAVDELHKRGFPLTSPCEPNGLQAIHIAALRGHLDVVRTLVLCGVSTAESDEEGRTALHHACLRSRTAVIGYLLSLESAPADINRGDGRGWNALHHSCNQGSLDVTELLLQSGASLTCRTIRSRCTALHFAVQKGHLMCARCLIRAGADVDRPDGRGYTSLHYAAKLGHTSLIAFLIKSHASVSSRTHRLKTEPIHLAAQEGHADCIIELVEGGASVNCQDVDLWTPLHCASCNGQTDCAQILIEHGANVHFTAAKHHVNPIHLAAQEGHLHCLKYLLSHGADPRCTDSGGSTPLHKSAKEGKSECVQYLLKFAADTIHFRSKKHGRQPLHMAATFGHLNVIKVLYEAGSDLNFKDREGLTPLHLANKHGHQQCVKYLTICISGVCAGDYPSDKLSTVSGMSSDDAVARVKAMLSLSEDSDGRSTITGIQTGNQLCVGEDTIHSSFLERQQPEGSSTNRLRGDVIHESKLSVVTKRRARRVSKLCTAQVSLTEDSLKQETGKETKITLHHDQVHIYCKEMKMKTN